MSNEAEAIGPGVIVIVKLRPDCSGGDRPHNPHEHGIYGRVTEIDYGNDHPVFVFFTDHLPTEERLPVGRWFARDELVRA